METKQLQTWIKRLNDLTNELFILCSEMSQYRKGLVEEDFCQMCAKSPAPFTVCSECFWKAKPEGLVEKRAPTQA